MSSMPKVGHRPTQLHPSFNFSRGKKHETPSSLLLLQGAGARAASVGIGTLGWEWGGNWELGRKEGRKGERARVSE